MFAQHPKRLYIKPKQPLGIVIMSPVRELYNPVITKLLREHDQLPHDKLDERKSFQRRILFLMNAIKYSEFEDSFA